MAKHSKIFAVSPLAVRTRRAYFDCKFGQLHVRTAFPATGGFDEQVTLFCLHPSEGIEPNLRSGSCPKLPTSVRPMRRICPVSANPIRHRGARSQHCGCRSCRVRPRERLASASNRCSGRGIRRSGGARARGRAPRSGAPFGAFAGFPPMDRIPVVKQQSLVLRMKLGAADDPTGVRACCRTPGSSSLKSMPQTSSMQLRRRWRSRSTPSSTNKARRARATQ